MSNHTEIPTPLPLEQLLSRNDIWRGHSAHLSPHMALDSGYAMLNTALLHKGWPLGSLIEVCQQNLSHSEWLLFAPALRETPGGYLVLLNPPATPFVQGLIQAGLDLERIIVIHAPDKSDFLVSFTELARTPACDALLAWQPIQPLSYTELRKCLLATAESQGLYVLFRPATTQQQSSPAALRLRTEVHDTELHISIFKQKGALQTHTHQAIKLPLPETWHGLPPYSLLDRELLPEEITAQDMAIKTTESVRSRLNTKTTSLHRKRP